MADFQKYDLPKMSTCQKHQPEPFGHFMLGKTFRQVEWNGAL
jgi:hypothetical protein